MKTILAFVTLGAFLTLAQGRSVSSAPHESGIALLRQASQELLEIKALLSGDVERTRDGRYTLIDLLEYIDKVYKDVMVLKKWAERDEQTLKCYHDFVSSIKHIPERGYSVYIRTTRLAMTLMSRDGELEGCQKDGGGPDAVAKCMEGVDGKYNPMIDTLLKGINEDMAYFDGLRGQVEELCY